MISARLRAAVMCAALAAAPGVSAHSGDQSPPAGPPPPRVSLVAVTLATRGDERVVSISANGPLTAPTAGVLQNPPRIYLDFSGVTAGISGGSQSDALVSAIRVAVHRTTPLTTRIVFDLRGDASHAIDVSQAAAGRIEVRLRATGGLARDAGAGPGRSERPRAAADPASALRAAFDRFETLRGLLESIDRRIAPPAGSLESAAETIALIRQQLAPAGRPSSRGVPASGSLSGACTLADRAIAQAKADGSAISLEAASAAAGALMLIERMRGELPARTR